MATIKEYPFDLSDLKDNDETKKPPAPQPPNNTPQPPNNTPQTPNNTPQPPNNTPVPPTNMPYQPTPTPQPPVQSYAPAFGVTKSEEKRKVSIMAEEKPHEQKSYEKSRHSHSTAEGPVRRKSSMHHTVIDTEPSLWEQSGATQSRTRSASDTDQADLADFHKLLVASGSCSASSVSLAERSSVSQTGLVLLCISIIIT